VAFATINNAFWSGTRGEKKEKSLDAVEHLASKFYTVGIFSGIFSHIILTPVNFFSRYAASAVNDSKTFVIDRSALHVTSYRTTNANSCDACLNLGVNPLPENQAQPENFVLSKASVIASIFPVAGLKFRHNQFGHIICYHKENRRRLILRIIFLVFPKAANYRRSIRISNNKQNP